MIDIPSLSSGLIASARAAGADAADVLFFESTSLSVSRRMRKSEGLERSESRGVGLRVFVGQGAAMISSSDIGKTALDEIVERAVAMARLAPPDPDAKLADPSLFAGDVPDLELFEGLEPSAVYLQEQCARAEDAALAVPGVSNSEGAEASYGASRFTLATSNGFLRQYRAGSQSLSVSVLAGAGTGMERDYDFTSARFAADLTAPGVLGRNAADRALARLNPQKIATEQMTVVFDPRVARSLLGSFASAINGNSVARGTTFLKDSLGKRIFAPGIRIVDDPHRRRGLGSRPFDAEGVANRAMALVEDGVLGSWLLDLRSASRLGLATTGHATRGLASPPSPGTSNFYLEPGIMTPEELMSNIKSGFYVTDTFGMGVNLVTGDYSQGASGFRIENGEKTFAVSEVTIAGALSDMFARAVPANDLQFRYSTNAPTLRIDAMTVAGR